MITWILKTIICSGILIGVYILLLEKEKMHKFNRFYLLASIALSFLTPVITIKKIVLVKAVSGNILIPDYNIPFSDPGQSIIISETSFSFPEILLIIYLLTTVFLLYKFTKNLLKIYSKAHNYKSVDYSPPAKLVLIVDKLVPHSFFNYIFLNQHDFINEKIEKEILCHELTHVKQKHSIDILLMEILLVFFWFNPVLFLYRKAIKLNHEFLADDAVIKTFHNERAYQYLLIGASKQLGSLGITSQFNFSITKKRLLMITHYTSAKMAILKQCLCVVIFFTAILFFSSKETVAQVIQDTTNTTHNNTTVKKEITNKPLGQFAGGTEEGVSEKELTVYQFFSEKVITPAKSSQVQDFIRIRMEPIFKKMSLKQQREQKVAFLKPMPSLPRIVPTQKQFADFKNGKIYGVWINDKKANNSLLDNYAADDFAQVFVSKLYGAAKKSRNYSYQVNLMTKDYYKAYYDRAIKDTSSVMVFQFFKPAKK